MKLEQLTEDDLLKKMKPLKSRGVLNRYFFGEPYLKEGNLYLPRNIVPANIWAHLQGIYGRGSLLGPESLIKVEAEHIGLNSLTSREVCYDLILALKNIGLRDKLVADINEDKPEFNEGKQKELAEMAYRKDGYFIEGTGVLYNKRLSSILLKKDKTPVILIEHTLRSDTGDIGVLPKVQEIEGINSASFLAAYKRNIEINCVKSYLEEVRKLEEQERRKV